MLARRIAYDFNNLLTVILGNADPARPHSKNEAGKTLKRQISAIVEAAKRCKTTSVACPPGLRPIDLCELVTDTVAFLQATTIRKVSLATATPPSAFVYADEAQLSQMLINLFNNEVSSQMQSQKLSNQTANP